MPIYLSAIIPALLPIILIAFHSFISPVWLKETEEELEGITTVNKYWKKYNIAALILGIILGLGSFFVFHTLEYNLAAVYISPIVSVVTVLTVISGRTDFNLRLVDRWILRLGLVLILCSSVTYLINYGSRGEIIANAIVFVFISLYFFIPSLGMSDTRALLILVSALFPFFGVGAVAASIGLGLLVAVIFIFKQEGFKLKSLVAKVSLPLVPMIIGPIVPVLIFNVIV